MSSGALSRDDRFDDEESRAEILSHLTMEERLVCLWPRLGFRSGTIANHLALRGVEIEALYRTSVEKIRRLIGSHGL